MRKLGAGLLCAAVVAMGVLTIGQWPTRAAAPQEAAGAKWQYGFLVVGDQAPVFTTGKIRSVSAAPTGGPGRNEQPGGRYGDRVSFSTSEQWNTDVMTLDTLGAEGWEAVSMTVTGKSTTILMKRRM